MKKTPHPSSLKRPSGKPSLEADNRLREILRAALRQVMVPGLSLGLLACGSDALSTTDDFKPIACSTASGGWNPTVGLNPAAPVDYLSYGRNSASLVSSGSRCATAINVNACYQQISAQEQAVDCGDPECPPRLVINRANEVRSIDSATDLIDFLGRIDTPQEAALLAEFSGYSVGCGRVRETIDGFELLVKIEVSICPVQSAEVVLRVTNAGVLTETSRKVGAPGDVCVGRRPEGLQVTNRSTHEGGIVQFLAKSAELEAASIPAFVKLVDDLRSNNAPTELIERAVEAIDDEIRHASAMTALTRKYGGDVFIPRVVPTASKSLYALAIENAVEGCIRETYGALVAAFQARTAADPEIRDTMSIIAEDELRHAALAWQIASWGEPRLDETQRLAVRAARDAAVETLRSDLQTPSERSLCEFAGWPSPEQAMVLLDALVQAMTGDPVFV